MIVDFDFSSVVQSSSNPSVHVGDTISGNVAYDSTQLGTLGLYTFSGSSKAHTFSWQAFHNGSHTISDAHSAIGHYSILVTKTSIEISGTTVLGYNFVVVFPYVGHTPLTEVSLPTTGINEFSLANGKASL
jgi:hypothetical protein